MRINGPSLEYKEEQKFLTRPATVIKKIDEVVKENEREIEFANKQKSAVEQVKEKYTALYPTALVTIQESYDRTPIGFNKYKNERIDLMLIKFENGISIEYKVYSDGSLGRKNVNFGELKVDQLLQVLSSIEKPSVRG